MLLPKFSGCLLFVFMTTCLMNTMELSAQENRGVSANFSSRRTPATTNQAGWTNLQSNSSRRVAQLPPKPETTSSRNSNWTSLNSKSSRNPANWTSLQSNGKVEKSSRSQPVLRNSSVTKLVDRSFSDPNKFLPKANANRTVKSTITDQTRFVDPNKYLKAPQIAAPQRFMDPSKFLKQQPTSLRRRGVARQDAPRQEPSETMQKLEVSDLSAPIAAVPFQRLSEPAPLASANRQEMMKASKIGDPNVYVTANNYAEVVGASYFASSATWTAPNFHHRPLYFDDVNLERYGNTLPHQNVRSALRFFSTFPVLPYKMGAHAPCECVFTNYFERPGSCVPYQVHHEPLNGKGLFWQALTSAAIVIP